MRVSVITRHAIINYGSLLQAMATQKIVESLGHNCEIIDYIRDDEHYSMHEKTLLKQKQSWNSNMIKRIMYLAMRQPESYIAGMKFEKMQKKYLKLSSRYTSLKQLQENKPSADVYMTGSDQVWGPVENGSYDESYGLAFTNAIDKRISYAASFGRTEFGTEILEFYKKWLSRYNSILVREKSAVELLNRMGISSRQVLDPTLLLNKEEWGKIISKKINKRYILVYQIHNDKQLSSYAKRAAKHLGLPLIRVSATLHQLNRGGKFVWMPDVTDFLAYIRDAELMITDSFHGTAFAINFNTQFIDILPGKTKTRNQSILELTGLNDRILTDFDDFDILQKKIDFSNVNRIIEENRRQSIAAMGDAIKHE